VLVIATSVLAACGAFTSSGSGVDGGAAPDGSGVTPLDARASAPDGASTDAAGNSDTAAISDGTPSLDAAGALDGSAFTCGAMGGVYGDAEKACVTLADCAMVYRGCWCGMQPVVGVSVAVYPIALECEKTAAKGCALGCATQSGHKAEDGKTDVPTGTIKVQCVASRCVTTVI
jgi:hypothetical protein